MGQARERQPLSFHGPEPKEPHKQAKKIGFQVFWTLGGQVTGFPEVRGFLEVTQKTQRLGTPTIFSHSLVWVCLYAIFARPSPVRPPLFSPLPFPHEHGKCGGTAARSKETLH